MTKQYTDKFSEAEKEQQDKSAFICTSCNKKYPHHEATKREMNCCGRSLKELLKESFGP